MHEMLYEELRQSEKEILQALQTKDRHKGLQAIFEEELADVQAAIKKVETGNFGFCEISGEIIPENLMKLIPTLKSVNDISNLESFYKKTIHFPS